MGYQIFLSMSASYPLSITSGEYELTLASQVHEVQAAQRLRFEVFNLELKEGLADSYTTGLDQDVFDSVCDHLLVRLKKTGQVIGTYRLQSAQRARAGLGFYSEVEFSFAAFAHAESQLLEIGRACIHQEHRSLSVLGLLWKGIGWYARREKSRYLIGCSSINSRNPAQGMALFAELWRKHAAPRAWQTQPQEGYECKGGSPVSQPPKTPKLLRAYLELGAWICGPPAWDQAFGTIDYLTLIDLQTLPALVRARFMLDE